MAYKKVPRKFDYSRMIQEIKARVLFSDDIDLGITKVIAGVMGIDRKTVYDYLDGRVKLNLDFLHAIVIASDGDPILKSYLEPEGWKLEKKKQTSPDKATLSEEILDNHPEIVKFETLLMEPVASSKRSQLAKIELQMTRVTDELRQDIEKWKADHGA